MEKEINEITVLDGRVTVCFHGSPDEDKLRSAAASFIKAVLTESKLTALPE